MHFEDLWESCEKINKEEDTLVSIKELNAKSKLLEYFFSKKQDMSKVEYDQIIGKMFGEIVFTLTKISMQENINVFKHLKNTLSDNK